MTNTPAFTGIRTCPIFIVWDVANAAAYYRECLGFTDFQFWGEPACYCVAKLGQATVMLSKPEGNLKIQPNYAQDGCSHDAHLLVDDARAHFEYCIANGAIILTELREAPYGMLEFVVQDLDGYAIMIGEDL